MTELTVISQETVMLGGEQFERIRARAPKDAKTRDVWRACQALSQGIEHGGIVWVYLEGRGDLDGADWAYEWPDGKFTTPLGPRP